MTYPQKIISVLSTALLAVTLLAPVAFAQLDLDIKGDPDAAKEIGKSGLKGDNAAQRIGDFIVTAIELLLGLSAVLAVGAIIWGGIQIITSASSGGEHKVMTGKKTILYAIIGLIVIGLSFLIVALVATALGL